MRVVLALLLFLQVQSLVQEPAPEITVDVGTTEPNDVAVIRVTVSNPHSAELLWGSVVRIEEYHQYFVPLQAEYILNHKIKPGEADIGELTFQVKREAEAGTYPMSVSLSGGVGACEEGCVPYFIEKELSIKVIRNQPELEISHTIQGTQVVITLRNAGPGKAYNIVCDQATVGTLEAGERKEITIAKTTTCTIGYEDKYGKKVTQSYRIVEPQPDTPEDASSQAVFVVVGIVVAYILKKQSS